jgi:CMP-2-keto-3-deoxyoctulosonic acid synthetase
MELTKEYFDQQLGNLATKDDLEQLRSDFRAMKSDVTEIKQTLTNIDKRDKEDSNAFAKTLVKHDGRLNVVEQDLKNLKLRQA